MEEKNVSKEKFRENYNEEMVWNFDDVGTLY